jgi:polar amino acid transport system substrate-binding protein
MPHHQSLTPREIEPGSRKMRHIHRTLSAIGVVLSLLLATCAAAGTLDRIKSSANLALGYVDGLPPFSVSTGDNTAAGYSIDLCQHIADTVKEKLSLPTLNVKYVAVTPDEATQKIAAGEIDLLCTAASDSLERRASVSFSIPVFNGGVGVLVRQDADEALMNVLNGKVAVEGPKWRAAINGGLANKTFVVSAGSVSESWVRKQIARLGVVATIVTVDDPAKGVQLVSDHQADAYFSERVLLAGYAAKPENAGRLIVVDRIFTYEPLALSMGRNDDDFRLVVDTALSRLYQSDQMAELYSHYFGAFDENTKRLFLAYARH